ncbi:DNA-binding transcriptional LysR family regulator [Nocardia tenerifensis]|uniref:DNA-binding transcriptional LysR family regulator n=1 Tax=Nocardia tenerifensis TaxID=228006 RepID=A0A318K1B7_9NOCA|nr:LysR family transcriptional regulator [Nocardia tenerifensis]PXX60955.1 DNA-binding transcriptional LysR family regulator [Nocardia tenerifensis]
MLDVHRLTVLRSVVENGSLQGAATRLGFTPSAISQHIAALQRETGMPLVERHGRGIRPTEAGLLLTEHTRRIQDEIARAETALADLRAGKSQRLTIRYFATAGAVLVPPVVSRLGVLHPEVRVALRWGKGLSDSELADAEIMVLDETVRVPAGLRVLHLLDDPFVAVLPPEHPLAAQEVIELGQLRSERWVDNEWPSTRCRETMLKACGAAGFSPDFAVEAHDYAAAAGFVAAGLGVTLIPRLALAVVPTASVVCRPVIEPVPTRAIAVVVKAGTESQPPLSTLLGLLRHEAEKHG